MSRVRLESQEQEHAAEGADRAAAPGAPEDSRPGDSACRADGADAGEGDDRRRSQRADITVRIDYATVDEMFSEFTRDINQGGLFIETEKPLPIGTEVTMQFHLPGSQEVLCTIGRVVRVSSAGATMPAGMGIEFDELTGDDRSRIDRIVRSLRTHAGD